MKIFLDFDDVVFNTQKFISDYKKIFESNGISEGIFKKYYYGYPKRQKNGRLKKYDPEKHLKVIKQELGIETKRLKEDIKNLVRQSGKYVFADVKTFVKNFKKETLYLVSYAKTKFQEEKIENSKIGQYFKRVLLSDKTKSEVFKEIIKEDKIEIEKEKLYFLDDRLEQVEGVKRKYPRVITFLVKRKEGRYKDKKNHFCDFIVSNLSQVKKIISD